jgi:hypothetical protein
MITPTLAEALCRRGYDAESCEEAGRTNRGIPDGEQLAYATDQDRAILTFNTIDYMRLERAWKAAGREHYGIIVSSEIDDLGMLLRCVQRHLDTISPETQRNLLLWLDASADP